MPHPRALSRTLPVLLALFAGTLASGGCEAGATSRLNVVLIVVDTLGARHLGAYGGEPRATPRLDRLAAEGVRFRHAYAPAPWTQPSVASLFTSRLPSAHGVLRLRDVLAEERVTLAERLREAGYATAAVVSHDLIGGRFGFSQGFEHLDESAVGAPRDVTGERTTNAALAWLFTRPAGRPFFLFAHYFDPHYPYLDHADVELAVAPPADGRGRRVEPGMGIWQLLEQRDSLSTADIAYLAALYREEIAVADRAIGRLLDALAQSGLGGNTLVIVTADHGEELMEHGWIGHTRSLYDDLLAVPLIVSLPGRLAPASIDTPVSLLDLAPTVLEAAGAPPLESAEGRSLMPLLLGRPPGTLEGRRLRAEVSFLASKDEKAHLLEKTAFKTALIAHPWKLIHDLLAERWELYDLAADPGERHDLARTEPARFAALRDELITWERARVTSAAGPSPAALLPSADELARLRALGYIE